MDAPDEMVAKPAHEHALPEGYFMGASGDTLPFFDQEGRAIVLRFWPDGTVTWQLRGRGGEVLEPLVDAVKSAACLRSSDARLTLDGPDRRGWYVLRMDGAPVADLDPVESAAVAEVFAKAAQVLPPGVPLMQVDHAQPVPSSPDSGESRSRAAGPESEPAEPRRAGAPPHEASSYACERALRVVADLALLATRVRSLAAPYEAGGPSDELRRTVAGLLAPFLDYNASPIVAADAVLATAGISDALARDAKVAEIVAKWASGRNEPWPLTVALEVADAIAALYPEAGK